MCCFPDLSCRAALQISDVERRALAFRIPGPPRLVLPMSATRPANRLYQTQQFLGSYKSLADVAGLAGTCLESPLPSPHIPCFPPPASASSLGCAAAASRVDFASTYTSNQWEERPVPRRKLCDNWDALPEGALRASWRGLKASDRPSASKFDPPTRKVRQNPAADPNAPFGASSDSQTQLRQRAALLLCELSELAHRWGTDGSLACSFLQVAPSPPVPDSGSAAGSESGGGQTPELPAV